MQGDPRVLEYLDLQLRNELTATNQYFLHHRMRKYWGFRMFAKHGYAVSRDVLHHILDDTEERIDHLGTQFDLVATLFGGQDAPLSRLVYVLVGLSALWQIVPLLRAGSVGGVRAEVRH